MYAALALGGLLALDSPAEARPVDTGSKAATHFMNPEVNYKEQEFCYDIGSRRWKVPTEVCEDARDVANATLDSYLKKLDVDTIIRGVLMARCAPKEVSVPGGKAYEADARVCISLRMYGPYIVDKVLEDVDPAERQLEGRIFNGYAYATSESTFATSGYSEESHGRKVTKDKATKVVENYSVTNRALPWIAALSGLLGKTGFDDGQKGDVWKWAAGNGKVLKKQGVKSVYEMLLDEIKKQKK